MYETFIKHLKFVFKNMFFTNIEIQPNAKILKIVFFKIYLYIMKKNRPTKLVKHFVMCFISTRAELEGVL